MAHHGLLWWHLAKGAPENPGYMPQSKVMMGDNVHAPM